MWVLVEDYNLEYRRVYSKYKTNGYKPYKKKNMPQLLPFYFVNQLSVTFLVLFILVYVFGKYILPLFPLTFVTRMYITKL